MSRPEQPSPASDPGRMLVAVALIVIGILFALPSGLCTAFGGIALIASLVSDPGNAWRDLADVADFVEVTLGCLAIGAALIWAGVRLRRDRAR